MAAENPSLPSQEYIFRKFIKIEYRYLKLLDFEQINPALVSMR